MVLVGGRFRVARRLKDFCGRGRCGHARFRWRVADSVEKGRVSVESEGLHGWCVGEEGLVRPYIVPLIDAASGIVGMPGVAVCQHPGTLENKRYSFLV